MLRACGATEERSNWAAARCWCSGLFCGRGGLKLSKEFRKDFRTKLPSLSLLEFEDLVRQQTLFDGDALRTKWIARLDVHAASAARFKRSGEAREARRLAAIAEERSR
jgi:hypothetical protein